MFNLFVFHFLNSHVPDSRYHEQKRQVLCFTCIKLVAHVLAGVSAIARIKLIKLKNDLFKKKVTFDRTGKLEMISTFKLNQHFRKVSIKTITHVQEQKKSMSSRCFAYVPSSVKSPLCL